MGDLRARASQFETTRIFDSHGNLLDEIVGRPFDTAMALARMILSGLFDRFPNLKICVAHMGGGLLPVMGRLDLAKGSGS